MEAQLAAVPCSATETAVAVQTAGAAFGSSWRRCWCSWRHTPALQRLHLPQGLQEFGAAQVLDRRRQGAAIDRGLT